MNVSYTHEVPMGHRLREHSGRCRHLHGHNYLVTVSMDGPVGPDGMVVDFSELKAAVRNVLGLFDHAMVLQAGDPAIEACEPFAEVLRCPWPPTAENLAMHWADEVSRVLASRVQVEVRETRDCVARTSGDGDMVAAGPDR